MFGRKYWKPRENITSPEWNGFENFWLVTDSRSGTHVRQSAGIDPIFSTQRPEPTTRRSRLPNAGW